MRPAILAGSGELPLLLVHRWEEKGLTPVIAGIDGFADPALMKKPNARMFGIASAGKIISFLKDNSVTDLVITGRVSRPDFKRVKPDARGLKIISKILLNRNAGDDALLKIIRKEVEGEGITLRAVQEFLPEILTPAGLLTSVSIPEDLLETLRLGFRASRAHGLADLGQSVVVQNGSVIGLEDHKGTNVLICTAGVNKQSIGHGPVLVKTCKPQQDKALDLPTVGLSTAQIAAEAGFCGIVLQAGDTILLDRPSIIDFCNTHNIFLYGMREEDVS